MKMNCRNSDRWQVAGDKNRRSARNETPVTCHLSRVTRSAPAFTLIELLTVLGIIGVIAGFVLVVAGPVKKRQYIYNTQAEMAKLETAIERYHAAYGFYPPSPTTPPAAGIPSSYVNQLYYELVGTTYSNSVYQTLDGSAQINASDVLNAFPGVGGFMNCSKPGGGEDASVARNFLPDLKPKQIWKGYTNPPATEGVNLLIGSVNGPDVSYQPMNQQDLNPWRYNSSSPTNNPGSYDLWAQLMIGGKKYLICNWTEQVQINSPWP